ncbi:hypothetical protein SEVIR_2G144200v4 [Setaria viridis]|uniref:Uncharacterized protein n=1 Tax=Setaria viridis TaxID=4556 RepID=A0A4U6VQH2_SETVI|nr:transcription factor MYB4-like [Setaria viridis]TKW32028.1 hypothetical protein SEVIR_2G144200v2 [Setaria viridis]
MGRAPCCDKATVKKGPWSPEEDIKLKEYIHKHGTGGNWIALPHKAGLKRCGKSCRLRWLNYLRPNIKHGDFSDDEDRIICNLFATIGSRWSIIAAQLPGRTDNDIKNYWNTKLKKKLMHGVQPYTTHMHNHCSSMKQQQLLFLTASAPAAPPEAACPLSLQHLSSPHDYSHHYISSYGSSNSSTSLLSAAAAAGSHGGLLNGEHQTMSTSCLDSDGGLGLYFDELCATVTTSSGVHGQGLGMESFILGGFQLQEDHHKAMLVAGAGAGAANQLNQQYSAATSGCYDDEAKPLVSVTGGGDGAGGTSSSFFYGSSYSNDDES